MKMRVIPTNVHGVVDYVTAPALAAAPGLFRLDGERASALPPRLAGAGAAVYSALTDYELGARRVIPMRVHLLLDALSGTALASAPWVFGSARRGARHWLPHAIAGAAEVALSLTTKTEPRAATRLERAAAAFRALPPAQRFAAMAVPIVLAGGLAYAGRRRLWQMLALAADAVEEGADLIEDAADFVEDAAEDLADAARERAEGNGDAGR